MTTYTEEDCPHQPDCGNPYHEHFISLSQPKIISIAVTNGQTLGLSDDGKLYWYQTGGKWVLAE